MPLTRSCVAALLPLFVLAAVSLTGLGKQSLPKPATSAASSASPSTAPVPAVDYPDSDGGLAHLGKDLLSALKDGDTNRATNLAQSMVLPDPAVWYHRTFGDYSGGQEIATYNKERAVLPAAILGFFKNALQSGNTGVHVKRFDAGCDDNDGENTFGTLDARVNSTPLYDLRLYKGDKYLRFWPLAYVDGTFRFVAEPHPWDYFGSGAQPAVATPATSAIGATDQDTDEEKMGKRIRQEAMSLRQSF